MSLVKATFIRHGESMHNLKTVWAGWADAPLSNHGMNQARAVGEYFRSSNTLFTAIYASPLRRAEGTAQAILSAHREPKPMLTVSPDVREQHFGVAEEQPWSMKGDEGLTREELYARGIYPVIHNRTDKFPGGESLDDLQARAERAIEQLVMPHILTAAQSGKEAHIAIVSHGLCISELIAALMRRNRKVQAGEHGRKWTGLLNTAWTRLTIDVDENAMTGPSDASGPVLKVAVTHVNEHSHLENVKRQHGGIGSSAYDPAQKDIRAFFGGASVSPEKAQSTGAGKPPDIEIEEGRAASNVFDEVGVETEDSRDA